MAVGPLERQFYAELVRLLDVADRAPAQYDVETWPQLRAVLRAAFATRTRDEWEAVFAGTDACVAPVLSLREAHEHPHLAARGTFVEHHGVTQPAPAPRFSATPAALTTPPAMPGEHTKDVLVSWDLGDPDELMSSGAVR